MRSLHSSLLDLMGQTSSHNQHQRFGGGEWIDHGRARERETSEVETTMDWYSTLSPSNEPQNSNLSAIPPVVIDGVDHPDHQSSSKIVRIWTKLVSGDHPWVFLAWLGISMAIITLAIGIVISWLSALKAVWCEGSFWGCWGLWILFAIVFGSIALASTTYISVHASGSGIPECKVMLSDVILNRYLSLRTLIGKIVGLIAGFAASLSIGKEGPYVHIAAIFANQWLRLRPFRSMAISDSMRMQLLSAAVGVGVASAFGAPIGGVLFSIEVTSTYYLVSNLWYGFIAAVFCATTLRLLVGSGISGEPVALFITDFEALPYNYSELIVFALMGALIGWLALWFIKLTKTFAKLRRSLENPILSKPLVQVLLVAISSALIRWPWSAMRYDTANLVYHLFGDKGLPADPSDPLSAPSLMILNLALFVVVKLLLTSVTISLPIPCGLFMPVFAIGAAFGRLIGESMAFIFPAAGIHAAGYAVVGAAAMASATTRTVSTAVIVFEVTGQVRHMLPVMLAVIVANSVCGYFSISIYDQLLRLLDLPHNVSAPAVFKKSPTFTAKTAKDVMRHVDHMFYVTPDHTNTDIIDLLMSSRHFVFPVVDSQEHMLLLGQVQRASLEKLIEDAQRLNERMAAAHQGQQIDGASPFTADKSLSVWTGRVPAKEIGRRMRAMSTASADGHDYNLSIRTSQDDLQIAAAEARAAFVETSSGELKAVPDMPGRSASAIGRRGRAGSVVTKPIDTLNVRASEDGGRSIRSAVGATGAVGSTEASVDGADSQGILSVLPPRSSSLPQRPALTVTRPDDASRPPIHPPAASSSSSSSSPSQSPSRPQPPLHAAGVIGAVGAGDDVDAAHEALLGKHNDPSIEILSQRIPLRFGPADQADAVDTEADGEGDVESGEGEGSHHISTMLRPVPVDPAPFSVWDKTPVAKIHFLFTMLKIHHAFVTKPGGVLVGFISKREFYKQHKADIIEGEEKK